MKTAQDRLQLLRISHEKTGLVTTETKTVRNMDAGEQSDISDGVLMDRVARGDRAAYASLVLRHADRYLRLAERLLADRTEAEDAVQDAFARLWQKADGFNADTARFTTWFYRVVSNACTDRLRRKKRLVALPDDWDMKDPNPKADEKIAQKQRHLALQTALQTLPERQKLALTLCYYEDLNNQEAARIMNISVKALESLLVRGRRHLRAYFTSGRTDL